MKLPHKIEGKYEFVSGDNVHLYEATVERLEYSNGQITGFYTAMISVFPKIDPTLTGIPKVVAKIANEFRGSCHAVGNVLETQPLVLADLKSDISNKWMNVANEARLKFDKKGVEFTPLMVDLAFVPIGQKLEQLITQCEE